MRNKVRRVLFIRLSRNHIYCPMDQKIGQNVCLDEILNEFEFRSHGVLNLFTKSKKYLVSALEAILLAQST